MFTTGSKLFFGYAALALGSALVFAIGSEHHSWLFAVFLLLSLAAATAFLGVIVVTFRDGEVAKVSGLKPTRRAGKCKNCCGAIQRRKTTIATVMVKIGRRQGWNSYSRMAEWCRPAGRRRIILVMI